MTPGVIDPLSITGKHVYFEVLEWAARQPWCKGVVGLYDGSYKCQYGVGRGWFITRHR